MGELLYTGSTGDVEVPTVRGQRVSPVPVVHHYEGSENRTNIKVGEVTIPDKLGWDYLWVRYGEEDDPTAGPVMRPSHAYAQARGRRAASDHTPRR